YQEDIISEELINELVDTEDKYRTLENNVEKIGMLRNELETMTMGLVDTLDSTLKGLFTDEEINKARDIAMNLFDIEPSLELEQKKN
ncbi:dnak-like protein (heat shock protein of the hsp70 family), partial [Vairimorpha apis BRL 01]